MTESYVIRLVGAERVHGRLVGTLEEPATGQRRTVHNAEELVAALLDITAAQSAAMASHPVPHDNEQEVR